MNNVLITGINGFLGNNIANKFLKQGDKVYGIDLYENNIHGDICFRKSNVTMYDIEQFNQYFDIIIHCAGGSMVSQSLKEPLKEFQNTVNTTIEILEYIRLSKLSTKFIYPSSAAVYGNGYSSPIKENDKLLPYSPYGEYKKIVEELCEVYSKNFNINYSIIRFFSIYGIGLKKQLLWDACNKFQNENNIEFFGTGNEIRDFININDAVDIVYKISNIDNAPKVINAGSGKETKISDIISTIANMYNKKFNFNQKIKEGDPKYLCADTSNLSQISTTQIDNNTGIKEYVNWFKTTQSKSCF